MRNICTVCKNLKLTSFALTSFLFSALSFAVQGGESAFFQQRSQHAYNAVIGLPSVAPRLVQNFQWQISLEHANQFAGGNTGSESLILDGESTEIFFRHRQRLSSCWQLNADIPFIAHGEGLFDRAIDDWHRFFDLPDASRAQAGFFKLNYSYTDEVGQRHAVETPQSGIGDVQMSLQRTLGCFANADSALTEPIVRMGLKLPTGNIDELRGSGELDVYADVQSPVWANHRRWRAGAALGLLKIGISTRLPSQRAWVIYGSLGAQFVMSQRLSFVAQFEGHSPFYKSDLPELGDPAINIGVGFRYLADANQTLEFSISEDVAIDTTPDIVARIAWTFLPRVR